VNDSEDEVDDAAVLRRFAGEPVDQDSIAHYRGLLQRRLMLNRCAGCGEWHHPPRPVCPACWSCDVRPTEVLGAGRIFLLTFLAASDNSPRHPVATVDLDEQVGLRYTATIEGTGQQGEVRIGDRVVLTWIERGSTAVPAFRVSDLDERSHR
jgi:uncharacterized OB-fold protein